MKKRLLLARIPPASIRLFINCVSVNRTVYSSFLQKRLKNKLKDWVIVMGNFVAIVLFVLGLVLIIKCGDYFVDSASWIAEVSGVPKFVVGATIVSVGTTLPELLVSSIATYKGNIDMATGNAIGSVTANTGMILALFIICMPFVVKKSEFSFKALIMLSATAILFIFTLDGKLTLVESIILLLVFIIFFVENFLATKRNASSADKEERLKISGKKEVAENIIMFFGGAVGITIGAQLLVTNGTKIAEMIGISERVISVIAIAIGTSLPELVTTLTALRKKQGSLSVGNILGANIIDMVMILPVCSLISGGTLAVKPDTVRYDLPACLIIMTIAVFPTLFTKKLQRWQGILMMALYAVYLILTVFVIG